MENKEHAILIGERAKKTILNGFLWDKLSNKFIAAYEDAIKEYQGLNGIINNE